MVRNLPYLYVSLNNLCYYIITPVVHMMMCIQKYIMALTTFTLASLDTMTPTVMWIKHKGLCSIFFCSKYPRSTFFFPFFFFYKCAVFIIWNSTTKSICVSLGEGEGSGKGSAGINYLQTNLLFQHGAQKASVPAPPVIQEVLFFCSAFCFQCECGNRSC